MRDALGRLEGVASVEITDFSNGAVRMTVGQRTALTPEQARRALPGRYRLETFVVEIEGEVTRRGRNLWLVAAENRMSFQLGRRRVERGREEEAERPLREIGQQVEQGPARFVIRGEVQEERRQLQLLVESYRVVPREQDPAGSPDGPRTEPGMRRP